MQSWIGARPPNVTRRRAGRWCWAPTTTRSTVDYIAGAYGVPVADLIGGAMRTIIPALTLMGSGDPNADPLTVVDGTFALPTGPSLGVEVDEEWVRSLLS
jgi:L-alanine-DL-glutamate epimerase-like enolase superfamily enzyme